MVQNSQFTVSKQLESGCDSLSSMQFPELPTRSELANALEGIAGNKAEAVVGVPSLGWYSC